MVHIGIGMKLDEADGMHNVNYLPCCVNEKVVLVVVQTIILFKCVRFAMTIVLSCNYDTFNLQNQKL